MAALWGLEPGYLTKLTDKVCAASAAVNHGRRTLQTLSIRPAFSLKSCLALRCLPLSHCSRGCHADPLALRFLVTSL